MQLERKTMFVFTVEVSVGKILTHKKISNVNFSSSPIPQNNPLRQLFKG